MRMRSWLLFLTVAAVTGSPAGSAADVPAAPTEVRPALIGATVPDVKLLTLDGAETTLSAARAQSPAIIVLYRGGW